MAKDKNIKNKPGKKTTGQSRQLTKKPNYKNLWWAALLIALITFIVYLPVFSSGFVSLDDDDYIQHQLLIRSIDLRALFSNFVMGNYHPFVMLVYAILYHFYKINPVPYHTVNLLLHIINSGLVLWLMFYLTESFPVAFIVGLLFGIHPLHVESVAWVSELKDVMYALGFLAALICYVRYVKEGQPQRLYVLCMGFFLFALLSKAMAVSLTPLLFLIDYYLGRKFTLKTVVEKIPFVILSLIIGVVALQAQKSFGAIPDYAKFSSLQRGVFACYGFITYIIRLIIPVNLCAYYSYPVKTDGAIPSLYYIYPLIFILMGAFVLYSLRKTKKIFFGIAFYAITVFLVLQLLPVGGAITADRYSYIPSIGIFFLIAEGLLLIPGKKMKAFPISSLSAGVGVVFVLFLLFQTNYMIGMWKDSMTLWTNVIKICPVAPNAFLNRGAEYRDAGKLDEAEADFKEAIKQSSRYKEAWSNLGGLYWERGRNDNAHAPQLFAKALEYINTSIEIDPGYSTGYTDRGNILYTMGKPDEALNDFNKAIALDPTYDVAYFDRGVLYYKAGRLEQACPDFKKAASLGNEGAVNAYNKVCR